MLHCADQFVVTIDSVSMIADAISTGKPVFIHELAQKPKSTDLLVRWLAEFRTENSPLRFVNPVFWLFWLGIAYLRADRSEFIRDLKDSGLVREWPVVAPRQSIASAELCRSRVESLFRDA